MLDYVSEFFWSTACNAAMVFDGVEEEARKEKNIILYGFNKRSDTLMHTTI